MNDDARGIVDATDGPFAMTELRGLPLFMWGVVALRRVLRDESVLVRSSAQIVLELCARHRIEVLDERDQHEGPCVILPVGAPFVSPGSLHMALREARAGATVPVDAMNHTSPGIERVRISRGDFNSSFPLAQAVALGLALDDERLHGIARARLSLAARIDAVITDVDGVLTDGGISRGDHGEAFRTFNIKDGLGTRMLLDAGVGVGWLSSGHTEGSIHARAQTLGVTHVDVGRGDKGPRLIALCERMGVSPANVLYLGDDALDLPAMDAAGLCACPCDAHASVRARADLVLEHSGGRGCFREAADLVLDGRRA